MKMHLTQKKLFKSQALRTGAYENRIDQPGQMEWSQFSIKLLGFNSGNSILDNSNWDNISEDIIKKNPYLKQSETLFER